MARAWSFCVLIRCPLRLLEVVISGVVPHRYRYTLLWFQSQEDGRNDTVTVLLPFITEQMVAFSVFVNSICLRKFSGSCLLFLPKQR